MKAGNVLAFIGGVAVGAVAMALLNPKNGPDTRAMVVAYLKSKGITKEEIERIWDKVKDKIFAWSSMSDIEIAVNQAIEEDKD